MMTNEQIKGFANTDPALFAELVKGLLVLLHQDDREAIVSTIEALDDINPEMWPMAIKGLASIAQAPVSPSV